ncbi:MAG: UTP--glucose-1-phosphate uridylyltransferase [Planctomycetota bacterium]|jgi:UDP-N-acetylglucosamine/UDP-N-acetylgalactosamine diphosphorylase
MKLDRSLRSRLAKAGQEFLAKHYARLEPSQQDTLLAQLESLDLDQVASLRAAEGLATQRNGRFEPLPYVPFAERGPGTEAAARGLAELKAGRVGFSLLAGGQASRLRWDGPKGTYPVGPATERCLFRILVEAVVRAGRDHGRKPPLAVTTSATTDAATRAFFERQDCFGMDRGLLFFASQASLPALDDEGHVLLSAPDRLFTNPDGHGGAVQALEKQGVLHAWEGAGITTVVTFQVDNPLLQVVDADFIGRLWADGVSIVTKVILKERPNQKLGVVLRRAGRPAIVEYSELPAELAQARDPDGQLTYRLGSIAAHAFRLDFLRRELAGDLPLHAARKEIPCVDRAGARNRRWGVKFERFLFDLFPRADALAVVEVLREREYEPIKNAEGHESPATARAALDAEYRRWYREAGKTPPHEELLELSPLDAVGPEDLR